GGGPPLPPGLYCVGAPAMLAVAAAAAAATLPRFYGRFTCCEGPPIPRTGPAKPAAAPASGTLHLPRLLLTSFGGGPSTVMDTKFSPRSKTRPRTLFSSRSGCLETYLIFLNSSQSQRIRFMCLSKALKVPMKMRPSCRIHRIL
uniref:Uncharacterized protein n=1 Tax=Leptobrachium leishanense TaxID=445787 RepID=A0A8C5PCK8_9ANUR